MYVQNYIVPCVRVTAVAMRKNKHYGIAVADNNISATMCPLCTAVQLHCITYCGQQ